MFSAGAPSGPGCLRPAHAGRSLDRLEAAVDAHFRREPDVLLPFVFADPVLDPLRGEPRFGALLERAKLPKYLLPAAQ